MKKSNENSGKIFMFVIELLVGILLLINPVGFTSTIIIGFGSVLIVMGIICIIKYFKSEVAEASAKQLLLKGLAALILGAFCALRSRWFIVTFPIFTMVYGVIILLAGLSKVQWAVDLIRLKNKKWFMPAISAAVSIICAIVILMNPFSTTKILWMFTGISLIAEAAMDVISLMMGKGSNTDSNQNPTGNF